MAVEALNGLAPAALSLSTVLCALGEIIVTSDTRKSPFSRLPCTAAILTPKDGGRCPEASRQGNSLIAPKCHFRASS